MKHAVSIRSAVLQAINGRPSLLSKEAQHVVIDMLKQRSVISGEGFQEDDKKRMASAFRFIDDSEDDYDYDRPYLYAKGIAFIPVTGLLLNRLTFSGWGITGYDYIRGALNQAINDEDVMGIVFDVNSPGGSAQGCFELADYIVSVRGEKPMMALVNAQACSAAYAIPSAVGNIVAIKSSDVGSIGVYTMHLDISKMLEDDGIKIEFIYAGDHKVDGNPYQPLTDEVRSDMQASVDDTYKMFTECVAQNRGLDVQTVIDTQARVFTAEEALNLGLIDSVASVEDAMATFRSELSGSTTTTAGVSRMSKQTEAGNENAGNMTQADIEAATKKAVSEDRARRKAITTCDEAEGRSKLAAHLADNTDLDVESAKALLAASAKEQTAAPEKTNEGQKAENNHFSKAMNNTKNPEVEEDGDGTADGNNNADRVTRIVNAGRLAGVKGLKSVASK